MKWDREDDWAVDCGLTPGAVGRDGRECGSLTSDEGPKDDRQLGSADWLSVLWGDQLPRSQIWAAFKCAVRDNKMACAVVGNSINKI